MIGQDRLKKQIGAFTTETLPKSILLVGEEGCGKHTFFSEFINTILNSQIKEFKSIEEIESDIAISTYLIDLDGCSEKVQNSLLKTIEEPLPNVRLILFSNSRVNVIPTIWNRCYKFEFDSYSKEELLNFTCNESLISILHTPGNLLKYKDLDISLVEDLCNKILTRNKDANLSNLLSSSSKINWSGKEDEKIIPNIFYNILIQVCGKLFKEGRVSLLQYELTSDFVNNAKSIIQFDRSRLFESYLVELKYGT